MSLPSRGSVTVWVRYKGDEYGVFMEYELDRQTMEAEVTLKFIDEWPQYPRSVLRWDEVDYITMIAETQWKRKEGYE